MQDLWDRARGDRWGLARDAWTRAIGRSVDRRFAGANPSDRDLEAYLDSLHLEDLALACACGVGIDAAWEHFVAEFRPRLYAAARAVAGEAAARELADSLYAELYGLEERGGRRRSLFDYFHGRSSLATWLRAILAQRHVDRHRAAARVAPLDAAADAVDSRNRPDGLEGERGRYLSLLQAALTAALAALPPRDRLRLACYYVQELTLAETGRLLGEHEATVSRKLDRTRRAIRDRVEAELRRCALGDEQIRLCYEYALEEWPFDLAASLTRRE